MGSLAVSNYVFIYGFLVYVADSPDQGRPASGRHGLGDVALGVLLESARLAVQALELLARAAEAKNKPWVNPHGFSSKIPVLNSLP